MWGSSRSCLQGTNLIAATSGSDQALRAPGSSKLWVQLGTGMLHGSAPVHSGCPYLRSHIRKGKFPTQQGSFFAKGIQLCTGHIPTAFPWVHNAAFLGKKAWFSELLKHAKLATQPWDLTLWTSYLFSCQWPPLNHCTSFLIAGPICLTAVFLYL